MRKEDESFGHWLWRVFRRHFLAGILVVVPIGVVVLVLIWFFTSIDSILQPLIKAIFGREITGVGFAFTLVLIYLVGIVAENYIGRRLIRFGESTLERVPLLKQLYSGSKNVIAGLSGTGLNKAAFREVVLVEFPREGMQTVAFVTNEIKDEAGKTLLNIFIPTAPVPTSGYFEIVSEDRVVRTKIGVDEAMQMVISSGMISPTEIDTKGTPPEEATKGGPAEAA
jgi:uncharacterized membrane protein